MRPAAAVALAASLIAAPAWAEPCRASTGKAASARASACQPPRKFEPYDPDRVRAGRTPGFIDLGNGTEVRVSGRVRWDYDVRR